MAELVLLQLIWCLGIVGLFFTLIFLWACFSNTGKWLRKGRIRSKFAWYPVDVNGETVFWKRYLAYEDLSMFCLGGSATVNVKNAGRFLQSYSNGQGRVSISYYEEFRALNLQEFKYLYKAYGHFKNLHKESKETKERIERNKVFFAKMGIFQGKDGRVSLGNKRS